MSSKKQDVDNDLNIQIDVNSIKIFNLTWILMLGILPFDKAALTLYFSNVIGEVISLILNAITLVVAFLGLLNIQLKSGKKTAIKYILFFTVLTITYFFAVFVEKIVFTRFFSLICLLGYCLFAILHYDSVDKLLRDINKALFFIIILSLALYVVGNDNVMYYETATKKVFKGIVANRNSYSEISLFYITTNFYIWWQDRKNLWWRVVSTFIAVFTTILSNGATSIICLCLLLLLLFGFNNKIFRKFYSFNIFLIIYLIIFGIMVLSQYSNFGVLRFVTTLFGKSSSLTGRTDIWATTITSVLKSPIFGLGYDTSILLNQGIIENDPHNGLLYIFLTQGLIGLGAFIVMLFFIIKNNNNEQLKNNNAYMTMLIFVVVWLIKGLVESVFSYTHFVFWCALIVMELSLCSITEKDNG